MATGKKKRFSIEQEAKSLDYSAGFPWDEQYTLAVVEFGITPTEYWAMAPAEFALIMEAKRPTHINGIHVDDIERLDDRRQQLTAEGFEVQ